MKSVLGQATTVSAPELLNVALLFCISATDCALENSLLLSFPHVLSRFCFPFPALGALGSSSFVYDRLSVEKVYERTCLEL